MSEKSVSSDQDRRLYGWALPVWIVFATWLLQIGCGRTIIQPPPPPPVSRTPIPSRPDPCAAFTPVTGLSARLLAGTPAAGRRVSFLVTDQTPQSLTAAPSPYSAVFVVAFDPLDNNPDRQACGVLDAMVKATPRGLPVDIWSDGIAGLVVRNAIERLANGQITIGDAVFVDTPHRGRSPAGWPDWTGTPQVPDYAVTGSRFLTTLNARPANDTSAIHFINIWRGPPSTVPRSTVMQFPRAALNLVLRASDAESIWSLLNAPMVALRRTAADGPPPRPPESGPSYREREAGLYGPKKSQQDLPSLAAYLDGTATDPNDASLFWIESRQAEGINLADPLESLTDAVAIGYDAATRSLVITGYVDYFRSPLRSDFFYSALRSYRGAVPAISIDPRRPGDPPNQAPVRYEGRIDSTLLGGVLFEADRVMKTLGLGKDNISSAPVSSAVAGHRSFADAPNSGTTVQTVWRFWFEPERWHARQSSPLAAIVESRLRVDWQRMSGFAPSETASSFAQSLTQSFWQYAQEQPAFDQADQAGTLAAMARWIYESNLDSPYTWPSAIRTPQFTPTIQVRTERDIGLYRVTHIMEGGVVLGQQLRDVRDDNGKAGALLAYALQARPPNAVPLAAFNDGQDNWRSVFLPAVQADTRLAIGHSSPRDNLSDPAVSSLEYIELHFPYSLPSITSANIDDVASPPTLALGGFAFGRQPGRAVFNNADLRVLNWSDDKVTIALPEVPQSGRLTLRQGQLESNGVDLTVALAYREPPRITITNNTPFPISITTVPTGFGTQLQVDLQPGESRIVRVLPGSYRIRASARGALTVTDDISETRVFERGDQASLTYSSTSFRVRTLTVNNQTGSTLNMTFSGERTMTVPPGSITVQVPPGSYTISVSTRCGSRTDTLTDQNPGVTYTCVFR